MRASRRRAVSYRSTGETISLPVAALMLSLGAAGCNDLPSRRQFLPTPSPVSGTGGALVIEGPASIEPGSTARFTASLVDPAGARRDVTREALWSARGSGIAITEPGVATAPDLGHARILVSYGAVYTEKTLVAKPPGTFVIRGHITPLIVEVPGEVAVIDGAHQGRSATADAFGEYVLIGVAGTLRVRATMFGHQPIERTLAVNADLDVDFALTAPPFRSIAGRWRLVVTADERCRFAPRQASATLQIAHEQPPIFHGYRIVLPAFPSEDPIRATLVGNAFEAALQWGEPDWEGLRGVALETSAAVLGRATGELAESPRVFGVIDGVFTVSDTADPVDCQGTHRFEMRPQ